MIKIITAPQNIGTTARKTKVNFHEILNKKIILPKNYTIFLNRIEIVSELAYYIKVTSEVNLLVNSPLRLVSKNSISFVILIYEHFI